MNSFLARWALAFLMFPIGVRAETLVLNQDHTELLFKVAYLGGSEVTGRFERIQGELDLDDRGNPRTLSVLVDAKSINTANRMRDGHLRSNDFLNVPTYRQIVFSSGKISRLKAGNYEATGLLDLRGVRRPLTLRFELTGSDLKDTWGHESRFAHFKGSIRRQDFGMHWNKTLENNLLLVGDTVEFWGTFQLQAKGKVTPTSQHMIPDTAYIREREKFNRGEITRAQLESKFPALALGSSAVPPPLPRTPPARALEPAPSGVDPRSDLWWWVCFTFLGLIGFCASVAALIWLKEKYAEKMDERYKEEGLHGNLADFVGILLFFVYTLAYWYVGWGGGAG